jgi:hypothetical protein
MIATDCNARIVAGVARPLCVGSSSSRASAVGTEGGSVGKGENQYEIPEEYTAE